MASVVAPSSIKATPCEDAPAWRNFWGDTCELYARRRWCASGRLLNASAAGAIFGSPASACCACGRRPSPPAPQLRRSELLFFASHTLTAPDARLLQLYAAELHPLWLLLLQPSDTPRTAARRWRVPGVSVFPWSVRNIFEQYPRLARAARGSRALARERTAYLRLYYFCHASLALWSRRHGHRFPNVRRLWRVELDVLYAGAGLSSLLRAAARSSADVLLPLVRRQSETDEEYYHFATNRHLWVGTAEAQRVWSLVAVGRYSARFLAMMTAYWSEGRLGYEEIFLPMACAVHRECKLRSFGEDARIDARRCVYRPIWSCADFLAARMQRRNQLWHPVKNRSCYVEYLRTLRSAPQDNVPAPPSPPAMHAPPPPLWAASPPLPYREPSRFVFASDVRAKARREKLERENEASRRLFWEVPSAQEAFRATHTALPAIGS